MIMIPAKNFAHKMKLPSVIESRRPKISPDVDPSTLSNYQQFQVESTTINLEISFDQKVINGSVFYQLRPLRARQGHSNKICLDTSYLKIHRITLDGSSDNLEWELKSRQEPLGSQLVLEYCKDENDECSLQIDFSTTERCTALQWLSGKQTSGKPYVFSQLESIHARSLFPCFDTPSVKSVYRANITSPFFVVFSGRIAAEPSTEPNGKRTYHFEQPVPLPSYLIGIASGDLVSAPIGPRSSVYTEPFRLKDAQWEFEGDVEKFIEVAENLIFRYEWKSYDILINVNSYPYGGMESPNMTFATPTLIAHDKSNIDVIAHELAHSWSGNLVTNCSWNHFWLNEGWTVYLERRITGAIHGESTRHLSALIGWNDLSESISSMSDPERFSKLLQNLDSNGDPDEAFSSVPYEKGFNLLFHLENKLGGPKEFDPFIKYYFGKFARQSLDTYQFLDALYEFYQSKDGKIDILNSIDWDTWLYKPGLPPKPKFDTSMADYIYDLAKKWFSAAELKDYSGFTPNDLNNVNTVQLILFLDTLVQSSESSKLTEDAVAPRKLLEIYHTRIADSQNAEIAFRKYRFEIESRIEESYKELAHWLGTIGRMKFVRPGFRLLNKIDRTLAIDTFEKLQDSYHPICKALVKQDLGLS